MKTKLFKLLILLLLPTLLTAQVRPSIYDFTSVEQDTLVAAMMRYITPQIVQQHCDYTYQSNGAQPSDIHDPYNFLPYHRVYLEQMEDYLITQGHAQFVPLLWDLMLNQL